MVPKKTQNQPFLLAEDLSAIGTMSLGAATPIFATYGVPVALLPTQVLSTQTEGFETPAKLSSKDWIEAALQHWQSQEIQLSGALIGYVGQTEILKHLRQTITQLHLPFVVVDPVLGDDGALYPGLDASYVAEMKRLIGSADVITPNWTEAQLLTGLQMPMVGPSHQEVKTVIDALRDMSRDGARIIVTGITMPDNVATAYFDRQFQMIASPTCDGHFYGSGDVFSALLTAALIRDESLDRAVHLAVKGTLIALRQTSAAGYERRFGMQLSNLLAWLVKQMS